MRMGDSGLAAKLSDPSMFWCAVWSTSAGARHQKSEIILKDTTYKFRSHIYGKSATSVSGSELTSRAVLTWQNETGVVWHYIAPGKPTQNAFIERFNGSYRDGVLDAWVFTDLDQVREETARWLEEYNTVRPHESLGDTSPVEFLNNRGHADLSTYAWI